MPKLWVIGGPNGAGKSSWAEIFIPKEIPVISPDTIAAETGVNPISAGKAAIRERKALIQHNRDFAIDTTFSGKSEINHLRKAMAHGFEISLTFIGIEGVDLSANRVMQRVQDGGHHVPVEDIERRFHRSIRNLHIAFPEVKDVEVFDNSTRDYRLLLSKVAGKIVYISDNLPDWFNPPCGVVLNPLSETRLGISKNPPGPGEE